MKGKNAMNETSKVYFSDFRTTYTTNLLQKLQRLMRRAGIETIDLEDKFVAIKMHFGEPGNLAFLRPNWAKAVADLVRELGGKPFLVDCNTLYAGGRKNALDHLDTAELNGFSTFAAGCHVLIGDGLKGTDEAYVSLEGTPCEYVKEAKIGRAVMDADVFISLTHFKGHEMMGVGGAVKNIGMGCGSRAGKLEMHSDGKPVLARDRCVGCGMCARVCAHGALSLGADRRMTIDRSKCAGCGRCIGVCPKDALEAEYGEQSATILDRKTAEYALAVVRGRPHFHVSVVRDVSPNCDCHPENDAAMIPDVGMLASFDPVALDLACADLCNAAPRLSGTWLDGLPDRNGDVFDTAHSDTRWRDAMEHAVKIGLGRAEYELVRV